MGLDNFNQFIRSVELNRELIESYSRYPFCLKAISELNIISFHPNVTFIVGENGSGKSTLLEAIAVAYGLNPEGGTKNFSFSTRETHSRLNNYIKLVKGIKKPQDTFFFRAESFYNVASYVDDIADEKFLELYGGKSLHEQSHGESFFSIFMSRFKGKGIYILDEPEAALSPTRQMSLLTRIHELVEKDSQFIIATHSPILMAYPNADILLIEKGFQKVNYEETEHYEVTKSFVNNTKKMLEILLE